MDCCSSERIGIAAWPRRARRRIAAGRLLAAVTLAAVTLSVAGCESAGPIDHAAVRNVTWFRYAGGEDIRSRCADGGSDHYRFIYNARFDAHVRWYDLVQPVAAGAAAGDATLVAGVSNRGRRILQVDLAIPLADIGVPFRDRTATRTVPAAVVDQLATALDRSRAFDPGPAGLRLPSNSFYWLVMACRSGVFSFRAYQFDHDGFADVRFDRDLFALDPVDGAPPVPAGMTMADRLAGRLGPRRDHAAQPFSLQVGDNGLVKLF